MHSSNDDTSRDHWKYGRSGESAVRARTRFSPHPIETNDTDSQTGYDLDCEQTLPILKEYADEHSSFWIRIYCLTILYD